MVRDFYEDDPPHILVIFFEQHDGITEKAAEPREDDKEFAASADWGVRRAIGGASSLRWGVSTATNHSGQVSNCHCERRSPEPSSGKWKSQLLAQQKTVKIFEETISSHYRDETVSDTTKKSLFLGTLTSKQRNIIGCIRNRFMSHLLNYITSETPLPTTIPSNNCLAYSRTGTPVECLIRARKCARLSRRATRNGSACCPPAISMPGSRSTSWMIAVRTRRRKPAAPPSPQS